MDFVLEAEKINNEIRNINDRLNALTKDYHNILLAYSEASDFTKSFLDCCEKHGISAVAIQASSPKVPRSIEFPFGTYGNVFASEYEDGKPAIWAVVHEMGVSGTCGNTGQHQLSRYGMAKLVDGVYTVKDGVWKREDG